MRRTALLAFALATVSAGAQDRQPTVRVLQANPLGIALFGPTVEVLSELSPNFATGIGVRFVSLGLLPHVNAAAEDDTLHFSWMATLTVLHNPRPGLVGWFGGPRFELGRGSTAKYKDSYAAIGAEFGYRWALGPEYAIALGGGLGLAINRYAHRTLVSDRGNEYYPFGGFGMNVGWFFGATR